MTNLTPTEFFRYTCTDPKAAEYFEQYAVEATKNDQELHELEKHNELIHEQLCFARDLFEQIQGAVADSGSKKLQKEIARLIDDSYFEL